MKKFKVISLLFFSMLIYGQKIAKHPVLTPYSWGEGYDYIQEGLFRFVENGKIGFANKNNTIIIKAQYDFATSFKNGIAEYFIGGEKIYEGGKTAQQIIAEKGSFEDRHWLWGGNITERGYVNKYGLRFNKITDLKNKRREAWTKDGKHFWLNKKGKII